MSGGLSAALSAEESARLKERLLELLAWQIKRYTHSESSSVRVEVAQELLDSICFCLGFPPDAPGARGRELLSKDLEAEFRSGVHAVEERVASGKKLWREVCDNLPPIENVYLLDTLKSIGTFWRRYDVYFLAHEIPCGIDYPLAVLVPEGLLGVDYVNCYLARLRVENRFLCSFQRAELKAILDRSGLDYRGLPVNLFELVKQNAPRRS